MICYVTAQVNSSSKLTPQKLWSLPWDVSTSRNSDQKPMSKEELEKTSKLEEILKKIKSGEIETTSKTKKKTLIILPKKKKKIINCKKISNKKEIDIKFCFLQTFNRIQY